MQSQVSLVGTGRGRFDKEAEGNMTTEARYYAAGFADGANYGCKECSSRNWKKGKETDIPLALPQGAGPC